jgi:adenylosuccinate synthase
VGPGVVTNPQTILGELQSLTSQGVDFDQRLLLSDRSHVVMPWHVLEDQLVDRLSGKDDHIGTTMRGIGPCYRDKVGRSHAIRLGDLLRPQFAQRVADIAALKNQILRAMDPASPWEPLDADAITGQYLEYAAALRPMICETTQYLLDALEQGKRVLFEGAQGSLLDIDHGTFPFVTSSNSSGVGVCGGSGVPPKWINKVVGVVKAYSTRVGGGPMVTELDNEIGQRIRQRGREYGTTTGRPRRCGYLDLVALRYTARLSGVSSLAVMMLDVLSGFDQLQVATGYRLGSVVLDRFPSHADDLKMVEPIYETLPGWSQEITQARDWADLPANAQAYVQRIAAAVGVPVEWVSVGPDRQQTIHCPWGSN